MFNYQKTQHGLDALQQRTRDLNARQRRLLVLIGTEDFDLLGDQLKQRLAPPELIEQLLGMQLIAPAAIEQDSSLQQEPVPSSTTLHTEIHSQLASSTHQAHAESLADPIQTQNLQVNSAPAYLEARVAANINAEQSVPQAEIQPEFTALGFEDVKFLMMDTLQRHCGLMAKQLIQRILQAQDIRSLKLCQMQWITSLQETRLPPKTLNQILQQINHSLQKLNPT